MCGQSSLKAWFGYALKSSDSSAACLVGTHRANFQSRGVPFLSRNADVKRRVENKGTAAALVSRRQNTPQEPAGPFVFHPRGRNTINLHLFLPRTINLRNNPPRHYCQRAAAPGRRKLLIVFCSGPGIVGQAGARFPYNNPLSRRGGGCVAGQFISDYTEIPGGRTREAWIRAGVGRHGEPGRGTKRGRRDGGGSMGVNLYTFGVALGPPNPDFGPRNGALGPLNVFF